MALDFVAGCFGGLAGILVGHPFDTVKVCLQAQNINNPQYRGTIHCFTTIIRNDSFIGLYKGMQSPLVGVTFINAIIFGTYGNVLRRLPEDNSRSRFIAGAIAGTCQSGVACPMELIKTWMQLQSEGNANKLTLGKSSHTKFRSSFHCLHHVYKTHGLKGCYRGMNLTVLREAIGCGTYFASYDAICKSILNEEVDLLYVTISKMLFAGGMTGVISWLVTYPIDVLKTRIQADGLHTGVMEYSSVRDCFVRSYKKEGPKFLVRGLNSALLRAFPVNAATFAAVELFYKFIGSTEEDDEEY